ncbi:putative centrosomal protein of 120kDa [Plasmopara halstedii]
MSEADPDDVYASDEYELDSPAHSPPSSMHLHQSQDRFTTLNTLHSDANVSESESQAVTLKSIPKSKPKQMSRESDSVSRHHLLDNTPWTYIIVASQVRMLRVPLADSIAIRELRVYATIDKQAFQSQGSRWKHELHSIKRDFSTNFAKKQEVQTKSSRRVQPYRRSGMMEEARWVRGDGQLQWTFPMEKFRRLKAYSPRIKAFVYGIREAGPLQTLQTQMETLAHQVKQGHILSFGWFFLDLRTPDLPERWHKLQNSPFGGEILVSSTFLPKEKSLTQQLPNVTMAQFGDKASTVVRHDTKILTIFETEAVSAAAPNNSGEFLRIGDGEGQDVFVLSVFIQGAFNLAEVVKTSMGEIRQESERTGYWLSYSLFDIVVQTDIFFNVDVAEFPPIRDSFRLKSSVKNLEQCLEALEKLTVFLCTENRVLAGVEIPLKLLLTYGFFAEIRMEGKKLELGDKSVFEGKFPFPDFNDTLISASITVEFVEPTSYTDRIHHNDPKYKADEAADSDAQDQLNLKGNNAINASIESDGPVSFKLDHLRLKRSALYSFNGHENVCIELQIGHNTATGILVIFSYTNRQVFATCQALDETVVESLRHIVLDTDIRVKCFSSVSDTVVAESSQCVKIVGDDEGYPRSIVVQLQNKSRQVVGQCTLSCLRGSQRPNREYIYDASGKSRLYQLCIKLESIRDFLSPGGYTLRYQNPFLNSAQVTSDWFTLKNTGRMKTINFYCIFDLIRNPLQLKQEMQGLVNIDLISSDEEIIGSAIFSLSYLYFSEEHFCCSSENCDKIFLSQAETEAHWLEVHTESALPVTQAKHEGYSHSYRSCSINIPIVSFGSNDESSDQRSNRLGSICVSAYLEDTGLLTEERASARNAVLALLRSPFQEKAINYDETQVELRLVEAAVPNQDHSNNLPVVLEANEFSESIPAINEFSTAEAVAQKQHQRTEEERLREQAKKVAQLHEVLERERSAWKHEQHLQQLQWKRRFAEIEKSRMDELEEEWARREEERSSLLKSAQEEYQQLEQTLRDSLSNLETRERCLAVAEAALQREQEVKRDENESLQRRLKSEQRHTLALTKKETDAYERRVQLLESQLSDAERRAKQVEADFAEYRQRQRKLPESKLREEIAALKGNVSELEKQKMLKERECEGATASVEKMKAQLDQMANLLTREKKKHEARVVDELEKLRVKYVAREEKYVLDGDRDELRAIKQQLDELKGFKLRSKSGYRRFYKQRPNGPASRSYCSQQSAMIHQSRSPSESNRKSQIENAFQNGNNWDTFSSVEGIYPGTFSESRTHGPLSEQDESRSHLIVISHRGSEATEKVVDQVGLRSSVDSSAAQTTTELGRLLRERKMLLVSGAYDTQSYLVRELDRLISIAKENSDNNH